MTTPAHRADHLFGPLQLVLRLVLALAVALLSVPLLGSSAYADGETDAAPTSTEEGAVLDETPPPTEETPEEEPPPPASEEEVEVVEEEVVEEEPAPAPADDEQEPVTATVEETVADTLDGGDDTLQSFVTQLESTLALGDCNTVQGDVDTWHQNVDKDYDPATDTPGTEDGWINGNVNAVKGDLAEGQFVWQRLHLTELAEGPQKLVFTYDRINKDDNYAYDFVDHFYASYDRNGTRFAVTFSTDTAPDDPDTVVGTATVTWIQEEAGDVWLFWGAHIASELDWGPGTGAGSISGSSYHQSLVSLNCDSTGVGSRDNQVMASAIPAGFITIVKDAQPNSGDDFAFNISRADNDDDFWLDDDGDNAAQESAGTEADPNPNSTRYFLTADSYTIDELSANTGGWALTDITCVNTKGDSTFDYGDTTAMVDLVDGSEVTCTFTNEKTASIEVDKLWVINGGTPVAEGSEPSHLGLDAQLKLDGANQPWDAVIGGYLVGDEVAIDETTNITNSLCTLTGTAIDTGDNALPETVTLAGGANAFTVTNSVTCRSGLTLVKTLGQVGDAGNGPAQPGDWTLTATADDPGDLAGPSGATGTSGTITADSTYTLSESGGDARYVQDGPWTCTDGVTVNGDSEISVPAGTSTTCTVENVTSRVTLVKSVTNDDGGSAVPSDWTLEVGSHDNLSSGDSVWLKPGVSYDLAEHSGPDGYSLTSLTCSDAPDTQVTSVSPAPGEDLTCTFVNDDLAAGLTLIKNVVDPDGSLIDTELMELEFLLTATDTGSDAVVVSGNGTASSNDVPAGSYQLAESYTGDDDDFIEGDWVCVGGALNSDTDVITLANGDGAVCTVTNTAVAPQLTLIKNVPQGDTSGANLDPDQWLLEAAHADEDVDPVSSTGGFGPVSVPVGDYTLSESGPGAPGWTPSDWTCNEGIDVTNDDQGEGQLTLELGDVAVCQITNTPVTPELTLVKIVQNGTTGGTAVPADWTLSATDAEGATVLSDEGQASGEVAIGTYDLAESGPAGYDASTWDCDGGTQDGDQITLTLGDDVTCIITNTAQPSTLTLLKEVDPLDTGDDTPATAWTLKATGPTTFEGATGVSQTVATGLYALSESGGPDTYSPSAWSCEGATAVNDSVTIGLGQDVTCTIVNTAIRGDWTVVKSSVPVDGSTVLPGEQITYTLTVEHVGSGVPVLGVQVTDNLADVLDDASVVGEPIESDGLATITGTTLTWDIPEVDGTHTVSYTVQVDEGAFDATLRNVVSSPNCPEPADCTTEHFTPHFVLSKSSDPADGTTVEPGDVVTYTLTATNDSLAVLQGATARDNVSDILDNATLGTPLDSQLTESLDGQELIWSIPTLQPGQSASVSYSVTVDAGAWDQHLRNVVTPGPGGECPTTAPEAADCDTDHPTPHYVLWKTNVPGDGETVEPEDSVTYTLHLHNDSDALLSGHTVEDNLSDVLDDATVTSLGAGLDLPDGSTTLTWTVPDVEPGDTVTVSYTVLVDADAWDERLVNLVTPGDAGQCVEPGCTTDNPTPHWVLTKSSDPADGSTVLPGDSITYTLDVVNDSDGVVSDGVVTDNLSGVLDNATLDGDSLGEGASVTGTTLTWQLPVLQPGESASTSYTVTVNAGQWDADLVNVATPDLATGGECPPFEEGADDPCSTTHETPPVTTLVVQKVDFETAEVLAGATFALYEDNAPIADPTDPVIGPEDELVSERVTGLDGLVKWGEILPGDYLVEEVEAPADYELPEQPVMAVTVTVGENFVPGGEMAPIVFRDFAEGLFSVVAKRQFELVGTEWVESDGIIAYGELVKYVVSIEAIGPKLFHNVQVTDYVPGFNPEDTTSTAQAELVPGSAVCTGALEPICEVTVSEDNLVTWALGDGEPITDIAGDVEMVVAFPEEPADPDFDENGEFRTVLWNVGFLEYDEVVGGTPDAPFVVQGAAAARGAASSLAMAFELQHTKLRSNEVVIEAVIIQPEEPVFPEPPKPPSPPEPGVTPTPPVLPATGASAWLVQLAALGALAIALGLGLTVAGRRKAQEARVPGA